jgi:predicted DNA-binding protein (MmcQ/YjbR family)
MPLASIFSKPIDIMNIEDIQSICKKLPSVTQDIKWGHDLAFSVGGKIFCVVALDESPISASFKVSDEEFDEITSLPGFKPAPYVENINGS